MDDKEIVANFGKPRETLTDDDTTGPLTLTTLDSIGDKLLSIGEFVVVYEEPTDSSSSGRVSVSFHFGTGTTETVEEVGDIVEPLLDKRKFRVDTSKPKCRQGQTWTVGSVEVDKDGNIVEYEINDEYLKPSAK